MKTPGTTSSVSINNLRRIHREWSDSKEEFFTMTRVSSKTRALTQLSLLIALEAVMAFTPLGFPTIPPISLTILHIPVIIGAILMGPTCGGILGAAFGILAMIKASFSGNPADLLFTPFASGAPVQSIVMCIVPRVLLGVFAALLYRLVKRLMGDIPALAVSCVLASMLHTVMVLGCMWLFFSAMPLRDVFITAASLNCILEMVAAGVVGTAVCKPVMAYFRLGA